MHLGKRAHSSSPGKQDPCMQCMVYVNCSCTSICMYVIIPFKMVFNVFALTIQ